MNKIAVIKKHGWSTWYHEEYWVNEKYAKDVTGLPIDSFDYTNFGTTLDEAYNWTINIKNIILA